MHDGCKERDAANPGRAGGNPAACSWLLGWMQVGGQQKQQEHLGRI